MYVPFFKELEQKDNIVLDTTGLYMRLTNLSTVDLSNIVSEKNKSLLNHAIKKTRADIKIELTAPVFFHNNNFCLVEIKTEDWHVSVLLQKIEGNWYKKSYAGGMVI